MHRVDRSAIICKRKGGSKCDKNGTFSPPSRCSSNSVKTPIDSYRQERLLDQLEVGSDWNTRGFRYSDQLGMSAREPEHIERIANFVDWLDCNVARNAIHLFFPASSGLGITSERW